MRSTQSRVSLLCTAAVAALAIAGCSDQTGPVAARSTIPRPSINFAQTGTPAGQWLIQLKGFSSMANVAAAVTAAGGTVVTQFPQIGVMTVSGVTGAILGTIQKGNTDITLFNADKSLQWIPTAQEATAQMDQTDLGTSGTNQSTAAFFGAYQWGMKVIQAPSAWAASPGGSGKMVCVLDTGVDPGHQDLNGKVDPNFMVSAISNVTDPRNATPFDYNLHGTFVSSIISSNGIGVASVAPDAKLCSVKVLGVTGSGSFTDVITGIMYAANAHASVINMSLGAYFDLRQGGSSLVQALQAAVNYAIAQGTVVVAASGNNGVNLDGDPGDFLSIPAQLKGVISVGATGPTNQANFDGLANYSNYGGVTGVALVAPGGGGTPVVGQDEIIGACSRYNVSFNCTTGRSYLLGVGTSFASPHVAGAAAELRSKFTGIKPAKVAQCLTSTADNVGPSATFGAGRLNIFKALSCAI